MSNSLSPTELSELLAVSTVSVIFLVMMGIALLVGVGMYVLNSIGLYRMAKKIGHESAWLAWIPIAQFWLLFVLPDQEFKVLVFNKVIRDRSNAFWIYFAITFGVPFVLSILMAIPILGYVVMLFSWIIEIGVIFFLVCFLYPAYADLYRMFVPDSNVKVFAILSIVIQFAAPILMLVASGKPLRSPTEIEQPYNVY